MVAFSSTIAYNEKSLVNIRSLRKFILDFKKDFFPKQKEECSPVLKYRLVLNLLKQKLKMTILSKNRYVLFEFFFWYIFEIIIIIRQFFNFTINL